MRMIYKAGVIVVSILVLILAFTGVAKARNVKKEQPKKVNYEILNTWDEKTDNTIATLHPNIRRFAKEFVIKAEKELGKTIRIYSGLRTWEEQDKLYAQGRTEPGNKVTNAKSGHSFHNFGLSFDCVEIKDGKPLWVNPDWEKIAKLAESIGFEWGGRWKRFKDRPHFQMPLGYSLHKLRKLYKTGQRSGEYVNI